jgi:ribonuclease inhibitor
MPVRRKRCVLSGKTVRSLGAFYDEMARQLSFPPHFGRNLDALWDVLVSDVKGPVELVWNETDLSRRAMGVDFDRVLEVLLDAEKEREDFRVHLSTGERSE